MLSWAVTGTKCKNYNFKGGGGGVYGPKSLSLCDKHLSQGSAGDLLSERNICMSSLSIFLLICYSDTVSYHNSCSLSAISSFSYTQSLVTPPSTPLTVKPQGVVNPDHTGQETHTIFSLQLVFLSITDYQPQRSINLPLTSSQ